MQYMRIADLKKSKKVDIFFKNFPFGRKWELEKVKYIKIFLGKL